MKKTVFKMCYRRLGQKLSICGYWNGRRRGAVLARDIHYLKDAFTETYSPCVFSTDPHHRSQYLQSNIFLPKLNGDSPHTDLRGNGMHYCHGYGCAVNVYKKTQQQYMYFSLSPPQCGGKIFYVSRSLC